MRILVVEDEHKIADALKRGLEAEGYQVVTAGTGEEGFFCLNSEPFDLLLLDLMLPGRDGLEILTTLRGKGFTLPVLVLTGRDTVEDRVLGLDSGADDYLVKPFAFEELLARIRTLQRRTGASTSSINFADMELDMGLHAAHRAGKPIPLTRTEFDLLNYFLRHPRQVLTREELILNVWGQDAGIQPNILDVYIARLRRKIGEPPLIHTIYGIGYVLKEETV